MNYKSFIEKGYPVSSALVESACGHLVKERMSRTPNGAIAELGEEGPGMRWSFDGAQNILDLRAVNLNGDIDDFMNFALNQKHKNQPNKAA